MQEYTTETYQFVVLQASRRGETSTKICKGLWFFNQINTDTLTVYGLAEIQQEQQW